MPEGVTAIVRSSQSVAEVQECREPGAILPTVGAPFEEGSPDTAELGVCVHPRGVRSLLRVDAAENF